MTDSAPFLTKGTRYWIVRPRVGTGGVSGLGTLVSGAYIEVDPGPGDYARDFTGLEDPPEIRSSQPGRTFVLRANSLGSLGRGAPIYYRGVEAGQVLGYELAPDQREALKINVFVQAPYDQLVHEQTRFWNASGLNVATDGGGLKVHMASVQALLVGGVEFETPTTANDAAPAPADTEFTLYSDADAAAQANAGRRVPFLVEFDGSARGLKQGAPVEIRGIRVGSVTDVRLAYSHERETFVIQATVEVEPERIRAVDADTGKPVTTATMQALVGRGLRAQLQTGNFLTGDLYVDLDFHPNVPDVPMHQVAGLDVIPSVPTPARDHPGLGHRPAPEAVGPAAAGAGPEPHQHGQERRDHDRLAGHQGRDRQPEPLDVGAARHGREPRQAVGTADRQPQDDLRRGLGHPEASADHARDGPAHLRPQCAACRQHPGPDRRARHRRAFRPQPLGLS